MQSWQSPPILETISNIPDINWNNKNDLKCDWQRLLWPFQYLIMVRNCFKKRQIIFTKNKQTPEWYHHHPSQKSQNLRFNNVDIWKAVPTKASANWPLLIIFASCTSAKLKPFVQMSVSCIRVQGQAVQVSTVVDTSTFSGWGPWPKNLSLHVDCLHPNFFWVGTHNFFTK